MPSNRRSVLLGSSAFVSSLAGCMELGTSTHTVDLNLYNYTAERQPLKIEILREDTDEHGAGLVLGRKFTIPAPKAGDSASTIRKSNLVERRPYLVRTLLKNGRSQWDHHHFYPGENATDPEASYIDIRVYQDDDTNELYTRFM
ncbi:hypothetical protein [Halomicrococcus gelatinilyticus]|uniref:hypothetical protein n=1 Tax=Halomicrococcus gelatinilyticus TaxID=1702103 RepID=UPI002E13520A